MFREYALFDCNSFTYVEVCFMTQDIGHKKRSVLYTFHRCLERISVLLFGGTMFNKGLSFCQLIIFFEFFNSLFDFCLIIPSITEGWRINSLMIIMTYLYLLSHLPSLFYFYLFTYLFLYLFICFLGPRPWHMAVPRLEV